MKLKKEEESQRQDRINERSERSERQKQGDAHRAAWLKEEGHLKRWNEWQGKLLRAEADLKNKVAVSEQFGKRITKMRGETDNMERHTRETREEMTTPSPSSPLTQGGEGWEDTGAG